MTAITDWLDLMPETVTIEPLLSRDQFGVPTYGPPASYRARVNNKAQRVRIPTGELVSIVGEIWVASVNLFSIEDRLTLPGGLVPVILAVDSFEDENGPLFTKILMGDKHVYNVR